MDTRLPLNDIGLGQRFDKLTRHDARCCHPWHSWLIWDGRRWQKDASGRATEHAKATARSIYTEAAKAQEADEPGLAKELAKFAGQSHSLRSLNAMLSLAQSESGIPVQPTELDADPWLLNVGNGVLDLRRDSFGLRPHRQVDMITQLAPVRYEPDATCPLWERVLLEWMAGDHDLVAFLQRLCGYVLTGRTDTHVLPFCFGTGSNGKGVFTATLLELLGDYAMRAPDELLIQRRGEPHPTERADLHGKRLAVATENEAGCRWNETLIKSLTGGDRVRARRMREDFFEFTPTHKFIVTGNHRPAVRGRDHGIWRRMRLIPFLVTYTEDQIDRELPDKLRAEWSGILNWAIRGCLDWQLAGLSEPKAVRTATADYRASEDVLAQFIEDCCTIDPDAHVATGELRAAYEKWCETNGEKPLGSRAFSTTLGDDYRGDKRGGQRVRVGLRLK
ncbi:MAG: hypothetical protein KDB14_16125 [Planctomycetales bacterium]|nr:hypothetical protein [Planctomycetales bacterium]